MKPEIPKLAEDAKTGHLFL